MTQDEVWVKKYREVRAFIEPHRRNLSAITPKNEGNTASGSSITISLVRKVGGGVDKSMRVS